jgi:hypothetical protein
MQIVSSEVNCSCYLKISSRNWCVRQSHILEYYVTTHPFYTRTVNDIVRAHTLHICWTSPLPNILSGVGVTYRRGFVLDDWIYWQLVHSHNSGLQAIQRYRYSTHFQFTVAHALGFSVFTSRVLATDLSQFNCNFNSHMKSSWHSLILCCHFFSVALDCHLLNSTWILSTTVLYSMLLCFYCCICRVSYYFVPYSLSLYNSLTRTPGNTPCLLVRYLAMDVLFSRALVLRECVYRPVALQWVNMSQYI